MREFEQLLALFIAAVVLAGVARRMGAPYPVFLALGGALLAFVPGTSSFALPPDLALALFVAPVLLDAAYDASLRDLRDNWAPLTSLVIVAVGLTVGVKTQKDQSRSGTCNVETHTTATLTLWIGGSESNRQSHFSPPSLPIQS